MSVYTVHAPPGYGADVRVTPDRFVFVRDGFHFWAFVLSIVWLAWHRLWLALVGYIVLMVALEIAFSVMGIGSGARFVMMFIVAVLIGLEAASLWRWTLRRRKWQQLDVVVADVEEAAERRFFDRWSAGVNGEPGRATPSSLPPLPRASLVNHDILGSFPQPGVPR
jgi:hypothetical protein